MVPPRSMGQQPLDLTSVTAARHRTVCGGAVAENIARFGRDVSTENVIKAAQAADAHDVILQLPQGYNTKVGNAGALCRVDSVSA